MNHQKFSTKIQDYCLVYVEDDNEIRQYITSFLQHYCKRVYACDTAEEGLLLYKKYTPDILILDINLSGMSGVELATLIRQHDTKTRILISTAYTNKEFMLQAIELGLTRYLVKPMTNNDLVIAIEKCVQELENKDDFNLGEGYIYNRHLASILHHNTQIPLRHKEIALLELFIAHEDEVIRYETLEQCIWKNEPMTRDAIRSQIRNLREKIQLDLFENISGLGYRFKRKTAHDTT